MKTAKRRAGFLDLFLIFLIFFGVLGILLRWHTVRQSAEMETKQEFTISAILVGVDPRVSECIGTADTLYTLSGERLGQINSLETRPSAILLVQNGECYRGEWDHTLRCDILVDFSVLGELHEGRLLYGGRMPLSIGQNLVLYTERAELRLCILRISPSHELDANLAEK